jgi:hypothetical protein
LPDSIGNITVPEVVPTGVFPLAPDYPLEVRCDHELVIHQFGSGNAKVEQHFLIWFYKMQGRIRLPKTAPPR